MPAETRRRWGRSGLHCRKTRNLKQIIVTRSHQKRLGNASLPGWGVWKKWGRVGYRSGNCLHNNNIVFFFFLTCTLKLMNWGGCSHWLSSPNCVFLLCCQVRKSRSRRDAARRKKAVGVSAVLSVDLPVYAHAEMNLVSYFGEKKHIPIWAFSSRARPLRKRRKEKWLVFVFRNTKLLSRTGLSCRLLLCLFLWKESKETGIPKNLFSNPQYTERATNSCHEGKQVSWEAGLTGKQGELGHLGPELIQGRLLPTFIHFSNFVWVFCQQWCPTVTQADKVQKVSQKMIPIQ